MVGREKLRNKREKDIQTDRQTETEREGERYSEKWMEGKRERDDRGGWEERAVWRERE